jgi:segregation and condensation protein A
MTEDYRVNLDIYAGPLDLLLWLIRRDEVDIYDIPIARVTEQYVKYCEMIHAVDPNLAGDFLVMAATLMEIKTRMLLPAPEVDEETGEEVAIDPRAELVRQLLEYKAFKDAAADLDELRERAERRHPHHPVEPEMDDQPAVDLEDVGVWDLVEAFSQIMESIGAEPGGREVIYDDTPVEMHAENLLDRLHSDGRLRLEQVFEGHTSRSEMIGLFMATLELVRQKLVLVRQDRNFGSIALELNPDPPEDVDAEHAAEVDEPHYESDGHDDLAAIDEVVEHEKHQEAQTDAQPEEGSYVRDGES